MLKFDREDLEHIETLYTGIGETILHFEQATLPACRNCGSEDTADVQFGLIGRTIHIAAATTKFKLLPNGPAPGEYFCNACNKFFDGGPQRKSDPPHEPVTARM
jgi:hypothetical protein